VTIVAIYRSLRPQLPREGRIGFINTASSSSDLGASRFIAQLALAPLVIVDSLDGVDFAVTGLQASSTAGDAARAAKLRLVESGAGGVQVYRR
jgi:hypothetical protein